MAWTSPATAVANEIWTSASWNSNVRDNMLETMPGLATTAGSTFVTQDVRQLVERIPDHENAVGSFTSAATTYSTHMDGPTVTVDTGTTAIVYFVARMSTSAANAEVMVSVGVSGPRNIAPSDDWRSMVSGVPGGSVNRVGASHMFINLRPGTNTFYMANRVSAGTGTFAHRTLVVLPL